MQMSLDDMLRKTNFEKLQDAIADALKDEQYGYTVSVVENKGYFAIKTKALLAVKITEKKTGTVVEFKSKCDEYFEGVNIVHGKDEMSKITLNDFDELLALAKPMAKTALSILDELRGELFGCCSRYMECSDERKCVHPDRVFARDCAYKRNLENGKIFYGKNKNA